MGKSISKKELLIEILLVIIVVTVICTVAIPFVIRYFSENKVLCEDCQYLQEVDVDNLRLYEKDGEGYIAHCDTCGKSLHFSVENGKVVH